LDENQLKPAGIDLPSPDIEELLTSLLENIHTVLQDGLAGLYLYGSLVSGDFDPDISDIDLLAVTAYPVTGPEFTALQNMHREFARVNPAWDDRIEVVYISQNALKEFR